MTTVYNRLQHDFVIIRSPGSNEKHFREAVGSIKSARAEISGLPQSAETRLILYCIDTLFEIIDENDCEKSCDFADTIHNVPEILSGIRDISSFEREFRAFQRKYGRDYFSKNI